MDLGPAGVEKATGEDSLPLRILQRIRISHRKGQEVMHSACILDSGPVSVLALTRADRKCDQPQVIRQAQQIPVEL